MRPHRTAVATCMILGLFALAGCAAEEAPPATTTTPTAQATIVANAGPDQSVFVNTFVTLDGSKSTNAKGAGLTYSWTLLKPAGSATVLSNPTAVTPTFRPDVEGQYEASLVVTGDGKSSTPDSVTVTASGTNPPPQADAGPDQNVFVNVPVLLNGTKSNDRNGDPLSFEWRLVGAPSRSSATLFDKTTVAPSFTPDRDGTYILELTVYDGTSFSTPDSTTVVASNMPSPTAVASLTSPLYFPLNTSLITLDGNSSHTNPPGGNLTYEWTFNSPNPGPSLIDAHKPKASFSPPGNVAATYVAQLKVTEPSHPGPQPNFDLDTVSVILGPLATVKAFLPSNLSSPILTCTVTSCGTVTIPVGTTIQLDGTDSAVKPLTYLWKITNSATGARLTNPTSDKPTFTATTANTYSLELEVTDLSPAKNTNIRPFNLSAKIGPTVAINHTPANPGVPQLVSLSSDSTNPSFRYTWELTGRPTGSSAVLANVTVESTSSTNSFITDKSGNYTVKLTIKDTSTVPATSVSNTKTITANNPPIASISAPSTVDTCRTVDLSGAASSDQPDGSISLYKWSLPTIPAGSSATLPASTSIATTSFLADKSGSYGVTLTVTDNLGTDSAQTSASVTARPNPTGQSIYSSTGLSNGVVRVSACGSCHVAGTFDTNHENTAAPDLSNPVYDTTVITNWLKGGTHFGGTITPVASDISDLRSFLDSTRASCP